MHDRNEKIAAFRKRYFDVYLELDPRPHQSSGTNTKSVTTWKNTKRIKEDTLAFISI